MICFKHLKINLFAYLPTRKLAYFGYNSNLPPRLIQQFIQLPGFFVGKRAEHGLDFLFHGVGSTVDQFEPVGGDEDLYPSVVFIAGGFDHQFFEDQLIDQPGSIGRFVEHALGEFFDTGGLAFFSPQDSEQVKLLEGNFKRLENMGNLQPGPGSRVE